MRFRKVVLFSLGMVLTVTVVACLRQRQEPLDIATNQWPGYEPLYLARDLGYFSRDDVRLVELPSASKAIKAFRDGMVNAAALTLDESLLLLQDDMAVKVLFVMDVSNGADVVMARPEIKNLADLKGKRIGVESFALGAYMLARTLDTAGLKPSDIDIVPMTVDQHEEAYKAGKVDALVTFEPVRTKLLHAGAHVVFDSSRIPNEIFDVLVVSDEYRKHHPRQIAKLESAWFKALAYMREHPDDAARRMASRLGISQQEFLAALQLLNIPQKTDNDQLLGGAHPSLIPPAERLGRVMQAEHLLAHPVDPAQLLAR
jgi:NitT/TauT family transport system substrate-binding protein